MAAEAHFSQEFDVCGAAAAKITIFCKTARKTVLSFTLGDE
jgi:hypothetical protein